jgi:hypothetical protein
MTALFNTMIASYTYVSELTPFSIQQVLMSGNSGGEVELGRITPGAKVSVRTFSEGKERPWMLKAVTAISYIVNGSS